MSAEGGSPDGAGAPPPEVNAEDAHHDHERRTAELAARSRVIARRSIGSPILFTIVYSSLASAIYFSLGVIAGHALGLTPLVFLIAAGMFAVTAMTYVEGASLHQDRGGSTVFARYAFNELVSFIAGWAILLDYVILIAITAYSATQYLQVFWGHLGDEGEALGLALIFIAVVVLSNIRGFGTRRARRVGILLAGDIALQAFIVVLGLILFFDPKVWLDPIHLGSAPTWSSLIFALTVTVVAFTSLESASGLSGEVRISRVGLKRLVWSTTGTVAFLYVGIALVAITALPVHGAHTALGGRYVDAPMIGVVSAVHPHWLEQTLRYLVAGMATVTLLAAANSAMLGLSRLAYSLSTNRQIPSSLGRLHPVRSTPYVLIIIAGLIAAGLVGLGGSQLPDRHLRVRSDPGVHDRAPLGHQAALHRARTRPPVPDPGVHSDQGRGLPLPAIVGALASAAGWVAVMIVHEPARYVGLGWMVFGLALYVIYRRADEAPLLKRVTVSPQVLRAEPSHERDYGSVLVPLFGTDLDDDIVQTAALLVAGEQTDEAAIDAATIEAIWIFVMPMSLPLDASLPEAQLQHARQVLARAKAVGEEYTGVQVATATVRTRRAGYAIVDEARRRGVEAIVLGAEEPSTIRGGARLGGRGGLEGYVGDITKYVVRKANCRVIVTAPAAKDSAVEVARRAHRTGAPIV